MLTDRLVLGRAATYRVLLCLLLGVLLHGQAGVLRQLLGATHWHQPAEAERSLASPAPLAGWAPLQAWREQLLARSPLVGGHAMHDHGDGLRDHHAGDDSTVVALEPGGETADPLTDSLAGSVLQPLGLAGHLHWAGTPDAQTAWPVAASAAWRSASARLLDRPPRS